MFTLAGCAFLVFSTRQCAQNAICNLHHSQVLEVRTAAYFQIMKIESVIVLMIVIMMLLMMMMMMIIIIIIIDDDN